MAHEPWSAWRRDVALEMWVDCNRDPVVVRLAGVLDGQTAQNLTSVVHELLDEGGRDFVLDTSSLVECDAGGARSLADLDLLVRASGGRCTTIDPEGPARAPVSQRATA